MRFPRPAIATLALSATAAVVMLATLAVLQHNTEAAPSHMNGPIAGDTTWALAASPTPTPTPVFPSAVFTFVNNTGQPVNDLHVLVHSGGGQLEQNAPGCPTPSVSIGGTPPMLTISLDWSQLCVDPGESVAVRIFSDCYSCGPVPPPISHAWTVNGMPVGGSGATPTATPTPCLPCASPTPTPTPVGGIVELRTHADAPSDRPASDSSFPIGAAVALGVLALGAGGLYAVKLRRG